VDAVLVSLVVATKGRTAELGRFLKSVSTQTYTPIEVIVVDQNADERLKPISAAFPRISLTRLVSETGLSRARNVGVEAARGGLVAFPDDDCWYAPDLLDRVIGRLAGQPAWAGLAGRTMSDQTGRPLWRWDTQGGPITRRNVWRRVNSNSMFLRSAVFQRGIRFDETLGVGAGTPWGSAEEIDLILAALEGGFSIEFAPEIVVHHENVFPESSEAEIAKAYRYACGTGFVLRKRKYALDFVGSRLLGPLAYLLLALIQGRLYEARFRAAVLRGRLRGLLGRG
jgi:glycosyltransferase involved in cell wall biosynthesis